MINFEAKKRYPKLYNIGKEMIINMILEYYVITETDHIYSREVLRKFDDDRLIVELGFGNFNS